MRKVFLCMVLLGFLAGCGGGSSDNNPFAGSWSGTWTDATTTDSGTLALTISNSGSVTGTVAITAPSSSAASGTVTGTVNSGGQLNATYNYSGTLTTESGFVVFGPTGQMQGNLTETQTGAVIGTAAISLTK